MNLHLFQGWGASGGGGDIATRISLAHHTAHHTAYIVSRAVSPKTNNVLGRS